MKPTDLSVLILSINDGKPLVVTSETRERVSSTNCLVIDLSSTPPKVLSVYSQCRYPYFAGHLPEQFLDPIGNLRNGQGRIVFLADGAEDTRELDEYNQSRDGSVSPYLASTLSQWMRGYEGHDLQKAVKQLGLAGTWSSTDITNNAMT